MTSDSDRVAALQDRPVGDEARRLRDEGYRTTEIARMLDIAVGAVSYHIGPRAEGRRRTKRRSDAGTTQFRCPDCGTIRCPAGQLCGPCRRRRVEVSSEVLRRERVRRLHARAAETGFVPTVREAADVLGVGRSVAGDAVLLAFGEDERKGSDRRARRAWKEAKANA